MRVREHETLEAARADVGDGEVVVMLRGNGLPDRFGVMPATVEVPSAFDGRPGTQQPIGEFLQGWFGLAEREARKRVSA